ncbi:MAG: DNA methyltransferase [Thermodesulfobacteriota bacterium]
MPSPYAFEEKPDWRWWVTSKPLEGKPIHRWQVFPHSFTDDLVEALIKEWRLGAGDRILDPFVGAGTTLLAAKAQGVPATGYDLSPFAVLAARVKTAAYHPNKLHQAWHVLRSSLEPSAWNGAAGQYAPLVKRALPGRLLGAFEKIRRNIASLPFSEKERDFFRLALLAVIPRYSRAEANGGWLRWTLRRLNIRSLPAALERQIEMMLTDLETSLSQPVDHWTARVADARRLPDPDSTYTAVITSPPYPNRHDYTRVFGVQLMFEFLDWNAARRLRYQSFHSHVEARPDRPAAGEYQPPDHLAWIMERIRKANGRVRLARMIEGYFLDMYICLKEMRRVCRPGGRLALVVGNAQYNGLPIPVDEFTAELGERVGLDCRKLIVARHRGNSAQQMGRYGRNPSRESVVIFVRP